MLKRRVDTRLAWLGLTHKDFAAAIGMDKSSLSRALRADRPRQSTLERISRGLGLTIEDLMDGENHDVLTSKHPAFENGDVVPEKLQIWCQGTT
jgi:transcriptional regulator with XRE-family HTH domain